MTVRGGRGADGGRSYTPVVRPFGTAERCCRSLTAASCRRGAAPEPTVAGRARLCGASHGSARLTRPSRSMRTGDGDGCGTPIRAPSRGCIGQARHARARAAARRRRTPPSRGPVPVENPCREPLLPAGRRSFSTYRVILDALRLPGSAAAVAWAQQKLGNRQRIAAWAARRRRRSWRWRSRTPPLVPVPGRRRRVVPVRSEGDDGRGGGGPGLEEALKARAAEGTLSVTGPARSSADRLPRGTAHAAPGGDRSRVRRPRGKYRCIQGRVLRPATCRCGKQKRAVGR